MSDFDFIGATADQFTVGPTPEPVAEPIALEPVAQEPVVTNEPAPAPAPIAEPAAPVVTPEPVTTPAPVEPQYKWKDDFIKSVVEYYEKTGDVTEFVKAKTINFNDMSDEDIAKRSLRDQYPEISDKALDVLYELEVVDKFRLNSKDYSDDVVALGRELLKAEMAKKRSDYLNWQKNFTAPEQPQAKEQVDQQRLYQEALEKFERDVRANDVSRSILTDKRIAVKVEDGTVNFDLANPNSLVEMTVDNDKFFQQFTNPDGSVDYNRWYKTAAYASNQDQFEKALINHGKALGRQELTAQIKNPGPINTPSGVPPTQQTGDFMKDLLAAFAANGK